MVTCGSGLASAYWIGWKEMPRWVRKQFHRENESRVRRGLKPLPKESVRRLMHTNGGY